MESDPCDPHAECTNMIGSYECTCEVGYIGSGLSCCKTVQYSLYEWLSL